MSVRLSSTALRRRSTTIASVPSPAPSVAGGVRLIRAASSVRSTNSSAWRRISSNAAALQRGEQRTEIAVSREQHDFIDVIGCFHGADRKFDVRVGLDLASSAIVDKLLDRLGNDHVTVVIEPIDQGTDGAVFQIIHHGRVVERPKQLSALVEHFEKFFIVDLEPERLCHCVKFDAVNEQRKLAPTICHVAPQITAEAFPLHERR